MRRCGNSPKIYSSQRLRGGKTEAHQRDTRMQPNKAEIETFESVIRSNPNSPVFARLAALYIENGEYLHALTLCDRGTALYPEYATGFLLRARVLRHLKKYAEAIENYQHTLRILPRCHRIGMELQELLTLQKESVSDATPPLSHTASASDADTIERLAERLKDYKPTRPIHTLREVEAGDEIENEEEDLPFVSETLASIFFQQKQYNRAIEVYRQLIKGNPEKADIYLTKIKEAEEAKKAEQ